MLYLLTNQNTLHAFEASTLTQCATRVLHSHTPHLLCCDRALFIGDFKGCVQRLDPQTLVSQTTAELSNSVSSLFLHSTRFLYVGLMDGSIMGLFPESLEVLFVFKGFGHKVEAFFESTVGELIIVTDDGLIRSIDSIEGHEISCCPAHYHTPISDCCVDSEGFFYTVVNRTLSKYNPDTWTVLDTHTIDRGHYTGLFSTEDKRVWVVHEHGEISQRRTDGFQLVKQLYLPNPEQLFVRPTKEAFLFVIDSASGLYKIRKNDSVCVNKRALDQGVPVAFELCI